MQKFLLILSIIILHILWVFSLKIYYDNTYKKYLETQSNFDWEFVFKNKKLPLTENYDVFFYNKKIGTLSRTYYKIFEGYSIVTTLEIVIPDIKLSMLLEPLYKSKPGNIIAEITMKFDIMFRLTNMNLTVYEKQQGNITSIRNKNALLNFSATKIGNKLKIVLNSIIPLLKNLDTEIDIEMLKNYIGQNFIFFGSRPAVGKSWTIKLGIFNPIEAVVEEKFTKKFGNKEFPVYSISYSSKDIRGYSWVDENGEMLRLILYKPPISIIKQGTEF